MANVSHGQVLAVFQNRWDHASARTLLKYALAGSGVGEKPEYAKADLKKIVDALIAMGEKDLESVNLAFTGGGPAPATDAAPEKKDDKAPEKKDDKAPEKKDDKAPEKKDDKAPEKKDDKAPEKKDDKAPEKGEEKAPEKKDDKAKAKK